MGIQRDKRFVPFSYNRFFSYVTDIYTSNKLTMKLNIPIQMWFVITYERQRTESNWLFSSKCDFCMIVLQPFFFETGIVHRQPSRIQYVYTPYVHTVMSPTRIVIHIQLALARVTRLLQEINQHGVECWRRRVSTLFIIHIAVLFIIIDILSNTDVYITYALYAAPYIYIMHRTYVYTVLLDHKS